MTQKFTNGAMDERIVRLNEFMGVKMAQLSKGKRPAAKFNKEVANYLLQNWGDLEALKNCLDAMRKDMPAGCEEVIEIYDKRVKELVADNEPKFKVGDWVMTIDLGVVQIKAIENGKYVLETMMRLSIDYVDKYWRKWTIKDAKDCDVIACNEEILLFKSYSVQGRISLYCWYNGQTNNFYGKGVDAASLTTINKICPATKEQRDLLFQKMKEAGYEWDIKKKELNKIHQKSNAWSEEDGHAVKKSANKRKSGAPKTRKVGDHHPTQPWVWTEYKPGKFDWRTDPALKQKPGRKVGATANQPKKKETAGKAEKAEHASASKPTLTELLAKPTPQGLSKPQQNVIKALKKGFRLRKDGDTLWLTDAAGNNERVEMGVLEALQRRYKIDYIPNDIWYNRK